MFLSKKMAAATMNALLMVGGVALVQPLAPQAQAQVSSVKQIVNQAKAQKLVGEQLDGYLGFVKSDVSANIRAAVNEINITRKSIFTATAREKNVAVSDIAGLAGEKLVARAASGEMVKLADRQWHVAP